MVSLFLLTFVYKTNSVVNFLYLQVLKGADSKGRNMTVQSVQPNTAVSKGRKIGAVAGAGASVAYIAAKRDGIFTQRSKEIVSKHADDFISVAKEHFKFPQQDSIIAKISEATKHIGNKEKFAEYARQASEFIDDVDMKKTFLSQMDNANKNIHKLVKKDKIKCIGGAVALTVGALAAGGAIVGSIVGKVIDNHNQKKQAKEILASAMQDTVKDAPTITVEELEAIQGAQA